MASTNCLLCVLMACVAMVTAFPGGAQEFSCEDLIPGHGQDVGPVGYYLDHHTNVIGGQRLKIRIDGTRKFRGFFIKAVINDSYVGAFQRADNTRRRCNNAGLTQTDGKVDKTSKTIYWQAPPVSVEMKVQFKARIVQNYNFHSLVETTSVYVSPAPPPTTPKPRPPPPRRPIIQPSRPKQSKQSVVDTKQGSNQEPAGSSPQRGVDPLVQFSPDERREIKKVGQIARATIKWAWQNFLRILFPNVNFE